MSTKPTIGVAPEFHGSENETNRSLGRCIEPFSDEEMLRMIAVEEVEKEKKMFVYRFFLGLALFGMVLNILRLVPDAVTQTAFISLYKILGVVILITWVGLISIENQPISMAVEEILTEKEIASYFVYYWFHIISEGLMLLVAGYLIYQKF